MATRRYGYSGSYSDNMPQFVDTSYDVAGATQAASGFLEYLGKSQDTQLRRQQLEVDADMNRQEGLYNQRQQENQFVLSKLDREAQNQRQEFSQYLDFQKYLLDAEARRQQVALTDLKIKREVNSFNRELEQQSAVDSLASAYSNYFNTLTSAKSDPIGFYQSSYRPLTKDPAFSKLPQEMQSAVRESYLTVSTLPVVSQGEEMTLGDLFLRSESSDSAVSNPAIATLLNLSGKTTVDMGMDPRSLRSMEIDSTAKREKKLSPEQQVAVRAGRQNAEILAEKIASLNKDIDNPALDNSTRSRLIEQRSVLSQSLIEQRSVLKTAAAVMNGGVPVEDDKYTQLDWLGNARQTVDPMIYFGRAQSFIASADLPAEQKQAWFGQISSAQEAYTKAVSSPTSENLNRFNESLKPLWSVFGEAADISHFFTPKSILDSAVKTQSRDSGRLTPVEINTTVLQKLGPEEFVQISYGSEDVSRELANQNRSPSEKGWYERPKYLFLDDEVKFANAKTVAKSLLYTAEQNAAKGDYASARIALQDLDYLYSEVYSDTKSQSRARFRLSLSDIDPRGSVNKLLQDPRIRFEPSGVFSQDAATVAGFQSGRGDMSPSVINPFSSGEPAQAQQPTMLVPTEPSQFTPGSYKIKLSSGEERTLTGVDTATKLDTIRRTPGVVSVSYSGS